MSVVEKVFRYYIGEMQDPFMVHYDLDCARDLQIIVLFHDSILGLKEVYDR